MDTDEKLHAIALRLAEYFSPDAPVDIPALLFVAGLQVFGRPAAPLSREDKTAADAHRGVRRARTLWVLPDDGARCTGVSAIRIGASPRCFTG